MAGLLLAFLFFALLMADIYRPDADDSSAGEPLGLALSTQSDVRRRLDGNFNWGELNSQATVFGGDTIFTGSNSSVIIGLKEGQVIKVKQNTLLVLSFNKKSPELELKFGGVDSELKGHRILIRSNDNLLDLEGTGIITSEVMGLKDFKVGLSQGSAILRKNNAEVTLEPNKDYLVGEKVETFLPQNLAIPCIFFEPLAPEILKTWKENEVLTLNWMANEKACGRFEVLVFKNFEDHDPIEKIPVQGLTANYPMKEPQTFFWQVRALNKDNIEIRKSIRQKISFQLETPTPTATMTPRVSPQSPLNPPVLKPLGDVYAEKDSLSQGFKKTPVEIHWTPVDEAQDYLLEWSNNKNFEPRQSLALRTTTATITADQDRSLYYLRVRARAKQKDRDSDFSRPNSFKYFLMDPLKAPTDCAPRQGTTFAFDEQKTLVLSWKVPPLDPDREPLFELEFSKDKTFSKLAKRAMIKESSYQLEDRQLGGRYYWRVRQTTKKPMIQTSPWSDTLSFSIVKLLSEEPPE